VDGLPKGTNTVGVLPGNENDVWIGGAPDYGTARLLPGSIAQVAVFASELTASQLQTLYQVGTNTSPILSLIPLATESGVQLVWSQATLLQATNVTGPWSASSYTSPCTLVATNDQMFFRLE